MVRFVHAADIHLDSPLRGLEHYSGAPVDAIRGATRRALENLVALCIDAEADLLLIAGDLYDGDWRDYNTGLSFSTQMSRLRDAGVRVVLLNGNHDAASEISRMLRPLDHMWQLSVDAPQSIPFDDPGLVVHGQGFAERAVTRNLAAAYPQAIPGLCNVGMLHTCLAGREGQALSADDPLLELLLRKEEALREDLVVERARLDRIRRALAHMAARAAWLEPWAELAEAVALSADFPAVRAAREQLERARADARRLEAERTATVEAPAALGESATLLQHAAEITRLHRQSGQYLKGLADLPGLRGRVSTGEWSVGSIVQELRPGLALEEADARLRLPWAHRERIRELGNPYQARVDRPNASDRAVADLEAEVATHRARLEALGAPRDVASLRAAVDQARRQGKLEAELDGLCEGDERRGAGPAVPGPAAGRARAVPVAQPAAAAGGGPHPAQLRGCAQRGDPRGVGGALEVYPGPVLHPSPAPAGPGPGGARRGRGAGWGAGVRGWARGGMHAGPVGSVSGQAAGTQPPDLQVVDDHLDHGTRKSHVSHYVVELMNADSQYCGMRRLLTRMEARVPCWHRATRMHRIASRPRSSEGG